jgi:hypothetical protein
MIKLCGEEERQFWGMVFNTTLSLPLVTPHGGDRSVAAMQTVAAEAADAVELRRARGTGP